MRIIAEEGKKLFGAVAITRPSDFYSPFAGTLFPCLIWDHEGVLTDAERHEVAKALLDAGCRYAVCGGEARDKWHLAVDMEFVLRHEGRDEDWLDSVHVMTTSHEESPEDVAFFFVMCTNFDMHEFTQYLVLHVGGTASVGEVDAAVRRQVVDVGRSNSA